MFIIHVMGTHLHTHAFEIYTERICFSYITWSDVLGNNICQSNIYAIQKNNIIIVRLIIATGHLESFWSNKLTLGIANQIPINEKYCNNSDNFSEVFEEKFSEKFGLRFPKNQISRDEMMEVEKFIGTFKKKILEKR